MKVEHITLLGNSVIRDTEDILPKTRSVFNVIGWEYKSQVLHLPLLPFQIKITAVKEGAIFDIQKGGNPAVMNVCCFEDKNKSDMLSYVNSVADMFRKIMPVKVADPVTPQWLYSIVVNPVALSPSDMITAGEVELYIYEQLYKAWKKKNL